MISFKQLFHEKVPFDKRKDVTQGMKNKFGQLKPYTFGFDVELKIKGEEKSSDEILELLEYEYRQWSTLTRHVDDEVNDSWDDIDPASYFGISIPDYTDYDEWEENNPEPDNESEEYDDWYDKSTEIQQEIDEYLDTIQHYENEYKEEQRQEVLNRISEYPEEYSYFIDDIYTYVDMDGYIENVENELERGDYGGWDVTNDGDNNIELTSPILTNEDIPTAMEVLDLFNTESGGSGDDSSSAHIHIGVPDTFDVFDMLVLYDIVDEDKLNSIQPSREVSFTKGKKHMFKTIEHMLNKNKSLDITNPITIPMEKLEEIIKTGDRYMGVNLTNVLKSKSSFTKNQKELKKTGKPNDSESGRTIEFRYLSSEIMSDIDEFFEWIEYFQMIMKVAESRSQITFKNIYAEGDKQYTTITRLGEDKVRIKYGKGDRRPNRPIRDIK
jgi:hypothetical protein